MGQKVKNIFRTMTTDTRVKKYIDRVRDTIKVEYGEVPEEYEISLEMLATNYRLFIESEDKIKEQGMITVYRGQDVPNPMIRVNMSAQEACRKILNSFGLTPYARKKMDGNTKQADYSPLDDFLSNE